MAVQTKFGLFMAELTEFQDSGYLNICIDRRAEAGNIQHRVLSRDLRSETVKSELMVLGGFEYEMFDGSHRIEC